MVSAEGGGALLAVADEIAQAVQRHALIASYASDDPGVLAAEAANIRALLDQYGGLLGDDDTGARNPFRPEADTREVAPDPRVRDTVTNEVELAVSYRVLVSDAPKAMEIAHDRARRRGGKSACVASDSNASDLVSALFMIDGWHPGEYDQNVVRLVGESWKCGLVKH